MRINRRTTPKGVVFLGVLAAMPLLSACASGRAGQPAAYRQWPWHRPPAAAPVAVLELPVLSNSAVPLMVQQYWLRNTLRVDLGAIRGNGSLRLLPSAVNGWPVRLEFAVRPGGVAQLEVQGDQRVVFMVSAATIDGGVQVLPLSPTVYSAATSDITIRWH